MNTLEHRIAAATRAAATRALGYSAPSAETAVPILVNALKDDKDAEVKAAAADKWSILPGGRAVNQT